MMVMLQRIWLENRLLHKRVLNLAWPVMLANLSLPLAGAVDTAVVGHLPDPQYIGAVALGSMIFSMLYFLFGFLRMGTTGFVAQSVGANDDDEIVATYVRALCLAVLISLVFIALQSPIGKVIIWYFDATEKVENLALDYFQIRLWGAMFGLCNLVNLGVLFGLQRMRTALLLQLLLNGMNIALDFLFVLGFGWGVSGVAFATLISEFVTAIAGLWVCYRVLGPSKFKTVKFQLLRRDKLIRLAQTNTNIFIRTLCLEFVFLYVMWASTQQGSLVLAANAILLHLIHFLAYGLDGFAHAAEALAGNAYGMKNRKRLHDVVVVTLIWSLLVALVFCAIYGFGGSLIVGLITSIESVRATADVFLPWLALAPLVCVWPFLFDGVYIGLTRTAEMRNSMLLAMIVFFATTHLSIDSMANHGIWLGITLFMMVRGLSLAILYVGIERDMKME